MNMLQSKTNYHNAYERLRALLIFDPNGKDGACSKIDIYLHDFETHLARLGIDESEQHDTSMCPVFV